MKSYVINGRTFYIGTPGGNRVVLFLSGVSMVNAILMNQSALDHFNITGIVLSGIAGGVNPELQLGDLTVPARWVQCQERLFARESEKGWDVGWHTDEFGNFGMMFPRYAEVPREGGTPDHEEQKFWFESDPAILAVAWQVAGTVDLADRTRQGLCLEQDSIVGGNGVSGPTFVGNAAYRDWVWECFETDVLDMESAAVAHIAYRNNVPFIAFRSLSTLAGGAPARTIGSFFQLAADNSAEVVIPCLRAWAERRQGKIVDSHRCLWYSLVSHRSNDVEGEQYAPGRASSESRRVEARPAGRCGTHPGVAAEAHAG